MCLFEIYGLFTLEVHAYEFSFFISLFSFHMNLNRKTENKDQVFMSSYFDLIF